MPCRTLTLVLLIAALLGGCDNAFTRKLMNTDTVDWKTLAFTCSHEKERLPQPEPEAEALHERSNTLFQQGRKAEDEKLLRESFELTLQAAERGHVLAINDLIVMYLNGQGVKADESKAVEWAEKLMKMNVGMGYYHMGIFLQQGIGVKEDREAALTYFRKSADLGNAQGQQVVGEKIAGAVAGLPFPEKQQGLAIAHAMLQCALDQGLGEAGYISAKFYQIAEKNIPQALEAYQAAAKLGHNQSLFVLWDIFENGKLGLAKDPKRAACYKQMSDESDEDKSRTFPGIDVTCPLPPAHMP